MPRNVAICPGYVAMPGLCSYMPRGRKKKNSCKNCTFSSFISHLVISSAITWPLLSPIVTRPFSFYWSQLFLIRTDWKWNCYILYHYSAELVYPGILRILRTLLSLKKSYQIFVTKLQIMPFSLRISKLLQYLLYIFCFLKYLSY